ncbi:MAG: M3 family metallopeptidase [Bacteroidales bacterium]|nr:M3 family metallopeptidase [Bacteroidales bacterium]
MKKLIVPTVVVLLMLSGCNMEKSQIMNPFLSEYNTPFGVPPFDIIKNDHFVPAFEEGIRQQEAEINTIVSNQDAPTFENTIAAFDLSGEILRKAGGVFYKLRSAETSDEIDSIARVLVPITSAHQSNMMLNTELFNRVRAVYENQEAMDLSPEEARVLKKIYRRFEKGGANLDESGKSRIRKIDEQLSMLSMQFGNNILAETNSYQLLIDDETDLAGLPESVRSAASDAATKAGHSGSWLFTLHKPSWIPFLQYSENRQLREDIYTAMFMRSNHGNEYDNRNIIKEILALRIERAKLLGYESHSEYMLTDRMAKEPGNVYNLLERIWSPALDKAKVEAAMMQEMIDREDGDFELQTWDWWYYAEKIRKEKYDLNEEEVRTYFSLATVKEGLFNVVNNLYGLTFELREDLPAYHEEVVAYEVKEKDGSPLGILYMDFHPRPGKKSGAWSTSIRQAHLMDGQHISPVHLIVMNFTRPTGGKPALLSFDETLTFFHEFGHALHSMLSRCDYLTTSGTSVAWDFVELPSQIMENWAAHPDVLATYAKHYESGEMIPVELINKLEAASKFNQGFVTVEYVAASMLDMDFHALTDADGIDINNFEKSSMERIGLIEEIIPRYRSTYFQHIFSGGYSAGYYSYIWAEVLDKDAFNAFLETSLYDQKTATAFRENILEMGGSAEEMEMYMKFRGKEPTIEPLLKGRGLQ